LNSVQKSYRKRSKAIMDELQNKYDSFDQIASKFKDKMMLML
jgi:histone acetyltransferase (RNA polymerase elongator complex component)